MYDQQLADAVRDLSALRAELQRTRAELKDAKSDAAFFEERMAIHSAADREQISQLTRERDANNRMVQETAATGAAKTREIQSLEAIISDKNAEIARLREELKEARSLAGDFFAAGKSALDELDRMRKALEDGGPGLIAAERKRQIEKEGWTPEHDDTHKYEEMAWAAVSYALLAAKQSCNPETARKMPLHWPWDICWWKPSIDPIRNLVKAGALIAAEIDRLSRKSRALNPQPAQQAPVSA